MKRLFCALLLITSSLSIAGEGPRIADAKNFLKDVFPTLTDVQEKGFNPEQNGGVTLIGLISRLLGDNIQSDYEGIKTKRYLYLILKNKEVLGVAHGSELPFAGKNLTLFFAYDSNGKIVKAWTSNLSSELEPEFKEKGLISQFVGKNPEDFAITTSGRKRHRVRNVASFLRQAKRPAKAIASAPFEKILRTARYNAAFMDVAYFLTQHPDMADQGIDATAENTPIQASLPTTGPEAFVRDKASTSPFERQVQILQGPPQPQGR